MSSNVTCQQKYRLDKKIIVEIRVADPDPQFLGLLDSDPDSLVRGNYLDPAPDPDSSTIKQKLFAKNNKKNLDFYCFVTSF